MKQPSTHTPAQGAYKAYGSDLSATNFLEMAGWVPDAVVKEVYDSFWSNSFVSVQRAMGVCGHNTTPTPHNLPLPSLHSRSSFPFFSQCPHPPSGEALYFFLQHCRERAWYFYSYEASFKGENSTGTVDHPSNREDLCNQTKQLYLSTDPTMSNSFFAAPSFSSFTDGLRRWVQCVAADLAAGRLRC